MSLLNEFKQFALKGNVVELAVAVVIAAAFGAIVSSLVDDVVRLCYFPRPWRRLKWVIWIN